PSGLVFDGPSAYVRPARPGATAKFDVMPADVAEELEQFLAMRAEPGDIVSHGQSFSYLLSNRRARDVLNSLGNQLSAVFARTPYKPAYLHPEEMVKLKLRAGDMIEISSDHGRIRAVAQPDPDLRSGIVSISHCWGGPPESKGMPGVNVNLLVSSQEDV